MSLTANDLVELVEKDDNGQPRSDGLSHIKLTPSTLPGWWLVKKSGREGWAPSNYLELVPPKPKAAPKPPPIAARRLPPATPAAAASTPAPKPKPTPVVHATSVVADASARPFAVFPGIAAGDGGSTPWKKSAAPGAPSAGAAPKPTPALAPKPGPKPPVAVKPGAPKPPIGSKPPAPGPRPANGGVPPAPPRPPVAGGSKSGGVGQMDLAAAVSVHQIALALVF